MNLAAVLTFLKQSDKQMHSLGCYGLTITLLLVLPMLWAAPIVLAVGFAKERFFDWYRPAAHTADWLDFVADAIGVGLACLAFTVAPLFAGFISTHYGLTVAPEAVLELLRG